MNTLIIVKILLFLEGILFIKFSPLLLLGNKLACPFEYGLGYISAFFWIWYTDKSRNISRVLITCIIVSMISKWFYPSNFFSTFFYIFGTSMITPLTCAFTMMQCNARQKRESWSFQYSFLILGRLVRVSVLEGVLNEKILDLCLSSIFVLTAALIPWLQSKKLVLTKQEQIYTPISALISQFRYLYFLISVLFASIFFFSTKNYIISSSPNLNLLPQTWILLCVEILTCSLASLTCPHRVPPQFLFLSAQLLISSRFLIFYLIPSNLIGFIEVISVIGFVLFSISNAQIIATHGKSGLEYTTCAFVDITRNALGPLSLLSLKPFLESTDINLIFSLIFSFTFILKYIFLDYPHDKLYKKDIGG